MKGAGRLWRSLVGTLCFVAFGIGGTLMSAVLMPLLMLVPGTAAVRRARARNVIGFCFRLLVSMLVGSGCMRLKTEGVDRLTRAHGTLVLANHPTYIDVVVLISLMPQANCVVKGALWRNPFYWGIVRAAGYVNNDSPEAVINACAKRRDAAALSRGHTHCARPGPALSAGSCPRRTQGGSCRDSGTHRLQSANLGQRGAVVAGP